MTNAVTDMTRGVYRRIYSGFTTGQRINRLSLPAEAWFWRVLAVVDDFGNYHADPQLLRDATAGKRTTITTTQVGKWLREMVNAQLVRLYIVSDEAYLHVVGFQQMQPAGRNGKRHQRYPFESPAGESRLIQVNPESTSKSVSHQDHNHNHNHNQDQNQKDSANAGASAADKNRQENFSIWTLAVGKFMATGIPESEARSFLGAQYKKFGKSVLADAITQMLAQDPIEPKTYLVKILQNGQKDGTHKTGHEPASARNARNLRENAEYIRSLQDGGGEADCEDPIGLLASGV